MREYYHTEPQSHDKQTPYILGLTASPILSNISTLEYVYIWHWEQIRD